ncbi:hypothetical protein GOP47_0010191 [Adiantum capillus-veneris]|uniref:Uncharacterized protein n=1 Tax=Adiantum capillus-veneris TaxID=13818 RepID=A0A9D4ZIH5_ADICA|nr:hypothetical protein GOP47_0010191 [Adiantum capillus-veneris]
MTTTQIMKKRLAYTMTSETEGTACHPHGACRRRMHTRSACSLIDCHGGFQYGSPHHKGANGATHLQYHGRAASGVCLDRHLTRLERCHCEHLGCLGFAYGRIQQRRAQHLIHLADVCQQGTRVPVADKQDAEVPTIDGIPGLPPTWLHGVPKVWDDMGKLQYELLKYFHNNHKVRFLLLNTFAEVDSLRVKWCRY